MTPIQARSFCPMSFPDRKHRSRGKPPLAARIWRNHGRHKMPISAPRRRGLLSHRHQTAIRIAGSGSGWMVPEARLELARLAAADFESAASTIPPLGQRKLRSSAAFPAMASALTRVLQGRRWRMCRRTAIAPDRYPSANHRWRCSEVPWVKVCGIGRWPALRCSVSSPICLAAFIASATSPGSILPKRASA